MSAEIDPEVASRLCAACGICCNGVLFQEVHLQPDDSIKSISALGLRLKSRRGKRYFEQPCRAFCGTHCSVYEERPERCRSFSCRQLERVGNGDIDESVAMANIQYAMQLVERVNQLLESVGTSNAKRSLKQRFEHATSEPVSVDDLSGAMEIRARLMQGYLELKELLDAEFRVYE